MKLNLTARVLGQRRQFFERQNLAIRLERKGAARARASDTSNCTKSGSGNSRRRDHRAMLSETVLASACAIFLQRQNAGADQVREPRALFRIEQRVDFSERLGHG